MSARELATEVGLLVLIAWLGLLVALMPLAMIYVALDAVGFWSVAGCAP